MIGRRVEEYNTVRCHRDFGAKPRPRSPPKQPRSQPTPRSDTLMVAGRRGVNRRPYHHKNRTSPTKLPAAPKPVGWTKTLSQHLDLLQGPLTITVTDGYTSDTAAAYPMQPHP